MLRIKFKPTKEWLEQKYVKENMTAVEIGNLLNTSKTPILRLLRKYHIPLRKTGARGFKGSNHPKWKGGLKTNASGVYIRINAGKPNAKYVKLARHLMEQHLGRSLTKEEIVHHINGVKTDNRIENLQLLPSQAEHAKIHIVEINNKRWNKCPSVV